MPTTAEAQDLVNETNRADIEKVYLRIFDNFAMTLEDISLELDGNTKYARELVGILNGANLIAEQDVNEDMVWQVIDPGTYDDHTRDEAEARIADFLGKPGKPDKAQADGPVSVEGAPCLCGCGEKTGKKSNYRPGHDARHAGNIGRAIADRMGTPGFDRRELLKELPTEALRTKAEGVAETVLQKEYRKDARAAAKAAGEKAKVEAMATEGTVTVGKTEHVGRKNPDGSVEYMDKNGDWKPASKTAAKTFQEG